MCDVNVLKSLFLVVTFVGLQAQAFQKEIPFTVGDPRKAVRDAVKSNDESNVNDLGPSRLELVTKNNLIEMKVKDPKKFEEVRHGRLENSPLYQSWVDEVNEALSERPPSKTVVLRKNESYFQRFFEGTKIDVAKKIAKKQLFLGLQRSWPWLKETIFNEFGSTEWRHSKPLKPSAEAAISVDIPSGAEFTVNKLNEMFHFSPKESTSKNFEFDFDFAGRNFAEIDRMTLKKGRVGLDVNSEHDVNRLEPGAEKIKSEDDGSSGGSGNGGGAPDPSANAAPGGNP